jgi:hypothetical protein
MADGRQLQYQTLQVSSTGYPIGAGLRNFDGAEELLKLGIGWLLNITNKYKLEEYLKSLEPQIRHQMPKSGGVLVGVVFQEAPYHYVDFSSKLFMYAYVLGGGMNIQTVYLSYQKRIDLTGTVSKGTYNESWQKTEEFLWITL